MQPAVSLLLLPEPYVKRTVAFLLFFISDHFPEGFLASYNGDAFPRPRHSRVQKISVQKHLRTERTGITTAGYSDPWDLCIVTA